VGRLPAVMAVTGMRFPSPATNSTPGDAPGDIHIERRSPRTCANLIFVMANTSPGAWHF
jgi:hypothetical protein